MADSNSHSNADSNKTMNIRDIVYLTSVSHSIIQVGPMHIFHSSFARSTSRVFMGAEMNRKERETVSVSHLCQRFANMRRPNAMGTTNNARSGLAGAQPHLWDAAFVSGRKISSGEISQEDSSSGIATVFLKSTLSHVSLLWNVLHFCPKFLVQSRRHSILLHSYTRNSPVKC